MGSERPPWILDFVSKRPIFEPPDHRSATSLAGPIACQGEILDGGLLRSHMAESARFHQGCLGGSTDSGWWF